MLPIFGKDLEFIDVFIFSLYFFFIELNLQQISKIIRPQVKFYTNVLQIQFEIIFSSKNQQKYNHLLHWSTSPPHAIIVKARHYFHLSSHTQDVVKTTRRALFHCN